MKDNLWKELQVDEAESAASHLQMHREKMSKKMSMRSFILAQDIVDELLLENPGMELKIVEDKNEYPVHSLHGGNWSFITHKVMRAGRCYFGTRSQLPRINGKAKTLLDDNKEMILERISGDSSCRETAELTKKINPNSPLKSTTIRNIAESEGKAIEASIQEEVSKVIKSKLLDEKDLKMDCVAEDEVKALVAKMVPEKLQEDALANPVPFSNPENTIELAPDAVFAKRQIPTRSKGKGKPRASKKERGELKAKKGERKTVSSCCGAITRQSVRLITLIAPDYTSLFVRFLAALSVNDSLLKNVCLISDGEKKIREEGWSILQGRVRGLHQILDWYHLYAKIGAKLSPALKDKNLRRTVWTELSQMLWHGCVDKAIVHLRAIDPELIKKKEAIEELVAYLECRREHIPVYSVRKKLGLRNSSNSAEKACDQLVSKRQKRRGMAWSKEGSYAFAVIRCTIVNKRLGEWLKSSAFSLKFVA
tara:strand:+ start:369 stop:1808 length:1440 start_codon:yes stop_codon:yes gene_type:complete